MDRTAHLTIREGDDIRKIARNFCKTYSLNEATRRTLEDQLMNYLSRKDDIVEEEDEEH